MSLDEIQQKSINSSSHFRCGNTFYSVLAHRFGHIIHFILCFYLLLLSMGYKMLTVNCRHDADAFFTANEQRFFSWPIRYYTSPWIHEFYNIYKDLRFYGIMELSLSFARLLSYKCLFETDWSILFYSFINVRTFLPVDDNNNVHG